DGDARDIDDLSRRWFSEVIRIDQPYHEILTTHGTNPHAPSSGSDTTFNVVLPNAVVQPILDADGTGNGGRVRLVFRIKTNRGGDDEDSYVSGFSSGTRGAAIVDNVVLNGWPAANGNFEASNSINNDTSVPATS